MPHVPPPHVHEVARPQLVARLDAAVRGALTIVAAPAGWGKTIAVAQWARGSDHAVTWIDAVTLSDGEFTAALAGAATQSGPNTPSATHGNGDRPTGRTVVVDHAERLGERDVAALGATIEAAHHGQRFVILTRSNDLFPGTVARLRIRDDVAYLRTADLSLNRDGVQRVLDELTRRLVSPRVVETVILKTGGWAAAVTLIGLAMRDAGSDEPAERFDADDPQLRAFVRDEVLARFTEPLRAFILASAMPDDVIAPLCAAITGRDDAADVVELLARHELVDDQPQRVAVRRFHPLLRDALRAELRTSDPNAERRVLTAAAAWHIERGAPSDIERAGAYLVRSQDWDAVYSHAEEYLRIMHDHGRGQVVRGWIDAVPRGLITADPLRMLFRAALLTLVGETLAAEVALRDLGDLEQLPPGQRAAAAIIRAVWGTGHLPAPQGLAAADEATKQLNALEPGEFVSIAHLSTPESVRTLASVMRARALWYLGSTSEAFDELQTSLRWGDTMPIRRLHIHDALAEINAWNGPLSAAERHVTQAKQVARTSLATDHPYLVAADLAEAHVLIERGEPARALPVLERIEGYIRWGTFDTWLTMEAVERAWLALVEGAPRRAIQTIDARLAGTNPPPVYESRCRVIAARALIELGDVPTATKRLAYTLDTPFGDVAAVAAQIALAERDLRRAREIVDNWPPHEAEQDALVYNLWLGTVLQAEGHQAAALRAADALAGVAESEGYARRFLDAGPHVRRLLVAAARRHPGGYFAKLLTPPQRRPDDEGVTSEVALLSNRERTVLQHLANRLTYAEIAEVMFISRNTVKTHAKSVYTKLGVSGRMPAIDRAQELGLL